MDSNLSSSKKRNRESWGETAKPSGKKPEVIQPAPLTTSAPALPFMPSPEAYANTLSALVANVHPIELLIEMGYTLAPPAPPSAEYLRSQERCSIGTCKRKRSVNDAENTPICAGAIGPEPQGHQYRGHLHLLEPLTGFAPTPARTSSPRRRAVVIKTATVQTWHTDGQISEIVVMSAIDFLTGERLIDQLFTPQNEVTTWRRDHTGVDYSILSAAYSNGRTLPGGWMTARKLLWDVIDADTILLGHEMADDLRALRMLHPRVVDAHILAGPALAAAGRKSDIGRLMRNFLNIDIADRERRQGFDSLVRAGDARKAVLWLVTKETELEDWVNANRVQPKEVKVNDTAHEIALLEKHVAEVREGRDMPKAVRKGKMTVPEHLKAMDEKLAMMKAQLANEARFGFALSIRPKAGGADAEDE